MSDTDDSNGMRLTFDRAAIQAVDREAIQRYRIPGIVLMENAAFGLLDHAMQMLSRRGSGAPTVLVCCGSGNNGGDGYALARHLSNHRVRTVLMPLRAPRPGSDAAVNEAVCRKMSIELVTSPAEADGLDAMLIVDALFGTGLDRTVQGSPAAWIEWINAQNPPVLAVDVPSGLDCNTGRPLGAAVVADRTVTFVGPKVGFTKPGAATYLGEVRVVPIGAPVELYGRHGRPLPP